MPPRLNLPDSSGPKIMVAPPRLNLRRAASYNSQDRGPLSATSSRFNFNHLMFSPPPSPSLPALVPRPRKSSTAILTKRPSRIMRLGFYFSLIFTTVYILTYAFRHPDAVPAIWPYFSDDEFEMVGQESLPVFPTAVLLSDSKGHSKWTISIPPDYSFPLSVSEYAEMGAQCREVSARARDLQTQTNIPDLVAESYDSHDAHYVDVHVAEKTGMLPPSRRGIPIKDTGNIVGMPKIDMVGKPVCESSMTFVLESDDAGLGNAMMMLWTFYGLAKAEGRSFFIDDTRWAYGKYDDIFQAPPVPDCRPPPRHLIVPCPFQARHLVVSAASANQVFPALLAKHHRSSGTSDKLRDLWQLARVGYEALFHINSDDKPYVQSRIRSMKDKSRDKRPGSPDAPVIGLHVRHGDQHPLEFQYRRTYIPAEVYLENAQEVADAYYNLTDGGASARAGVQQPMITILASDDPTVHTQPEFTSSFLAQERIRLASKEVVEKANTGQPRYIRQFVDEAFGWEGGFFAPMFWNLGVERKNNAANAPEGVEIENFNEEARFSATPSEQTLMLRSIVGRAYAMDLAVLAGASDSVVCAVSAMGCRLLGVMMPWEEGVGGSGWVNVDGGYGWTGISW